MFERTLEYIGFQYTRFVFRREIDKAQEFTGFLNRAKKILIILPVDYEDAKVAGSALLSLREKIKDAELTILTEGIRSTPLSEFSKSKVIRISSSHLNKLFLPRSYFLDRVLENYYDVVLDLNLDFVLYTAYICRATGAKIRIGFSKNSADTFYNIQFNVDREKPVQEIYNQFVQYLNKF